MPPITSHPAIKVTNGCVILAGVPHYDPQSLWDALQSTIQAPERPQRPQPQPTPASQLDQLKAAHHQQQQELKDRLATITITI